MCAGFFSKVVLVFRVTCISQASKKKSRRKKKEIEKLSGVFVCLINIALAFFISLLLKHNFIPWKNLKNIYSQRQGKATFKTEKKNGT